MRIFCLLAVITLLPVFLQAQVFYHTNFDDSGTLPAGWLVSDSRIIISNQAMSCCYTSSSSSPDASASNNVRFDDCQPISETVSLTVSGVINSTGKTNIRIAFGRRISAAWASEMTLQWSSNGSTWNLIDSDVSAGASPIWNSMFYDLPAGADNVANLRFRFSFTTTTNQNCTAPPNFRIDDFTVGADFSLPVELIRFDAKRNGHEVQLDWATASEINNDYFAVEHSADGKTFMTIGQLPGFGTTQLPQQYTFRHRQPTPGANYYRLRQVDLDGSLSFSVLRQVMIEGSALYHVFPSPAADVLNVVWQYPTENELHWTVYNALGGLVGTGNLLTAVDKLAVPVDNLPSGKYLLQIRGEQQFSTLPFIKL